MAANQVSGPGPLAKRTDIGDVQKAQDLPNADYGEQQAYQAQQAGAPMAADPGAAGAAQPNPITPIPLTAPTQRPNEDIMAGAPMNFQSQSAQDMQANQANLPVLNYMSSLPGASWALKNFVRDIKAASSA